MRLYRLDIAEVLAVAATASCTQILGFDKDFQEVETGSTGSGATGAGSGGAGGGGAATGGAGGSPTSSSSAGGGGGATTHTWDAQTATMNPDGTFTLPAWLVFESPSPGKTSQTSASTLKTGFGVDTPRARNVTGNPTDWGLSVESERTNVVKFSDSFGGAVPPWIELPPPTTMGWTSTQPDPAGGVAARLFHSTGYQVSPYFTAVGRTVSGWFRGQGPLGDPGTPGGPLSYAHFAHARTFNDPYREVDSTIWTRYSFTYSANLDGDIALETRNRPSPAGAIATPTEIFAYGAQIEPGAAYPSSYIPTTSLELTRKAETLSSPVVDMLVPGGFFRIELRFAPNYASGEQAGDHDLLFFKDGNNRIYLRQLDNVIVMRIAGQEMASGSLQWGREQQLSVIAVNTPTERSLSVTGATIGNGMMSQPMGTPVLFGNTLYLLSNAAGAQECDDLRYISFAPP